MEIIVERQRVIDLVSHLIETNSINPPGDECKVAEVIEQEMSRLGLQCSIDLVSAGRANLIARIPGRKPSSELIVYNGHLDTVPAGEASWDYDPLKPTVVGDRIYGLGAADMKAGLAAMIMAGHILLQKRQEPKQDVILVFTAGEETDSIGAKEYCKNHGLDGVRGIVVAEPSRNDIEIAEKGVLWLRVLIVGKTAHGARPDLGQNAIIAMSRFIERFERHVFISKTHELLGGGTKSINTIHGGIKTNIIPDKCEVTIDIRTVPGQNHKTIVKEIEEILQSVQSSALQPEWKLEITNDRLPVETDASCEFVQKAQEKMIQVKGDVKILGCYGYTDASIFGDRFPNVPFIICGPGNPDLCHRPNEYVEIPEIIRAVRFLVALAQ